MEPTTPIHLDSLVQDLERGVHPERALLKLTHFLSQDLTLLNIYLQLGYCPQSNLFIAPPAPLQVLSLIREEYLLPQTADTFLAHTPPKPLDADSALRHELLKTFYEHNLNLLTTSAEIGLATANPTVSDPFTPLLYTPKHKPVHQTPSTDFTPSSEDADTPRSTRGLKNLTTLVKELVCRHQPTSFKEVTLKLIQKLIQTEGVDKAREEKNVRRRVYDAINVLIAAGVLERDGRHVSWKEQWDFVGIDEKRDELQRRRDVLEAKRAVLRDTLQKYLGLHHLI